MTARVAGNSSLDCIIIAFYIADNSCCSLWTNIAKKEQPKSKSKRDKSCRQEGGKKKKPAPWAATVCASSPALNLGACLHPSAAVVSKPVEFRRRQILNIHSVLLLFSIFYRNLKRHKSVSRNRNETQGSAGIVHYVSLTSWNKIFF